MTIILPDGRRLVQHAPGAAASRPYIHALSVTGITAACIRAPGLPAEGLIPLRRRHGTFPGCPAAAAPERRHPRLHALGIAVALVGRASADRPPSFGAGQLPAVGFTCPSGVTSLAAGTPVNVQLGVAPAGPAATPVHWQVASTPGGVQVTPSSGTLVSRSACTSDGAVSQALTLTSSTAGTVAVPISLQASDGASLPPVVLEVTVQP